MNTANSNVTNWMKHEEIFHEWLERKNKIRQIKTENMIYLTQVTESNRPLREPKMWDWIFIPIQLWWIHLFFLKNFLTKLTLSIALQ